MGIRTSQADAVDDRREEERARMVASENLMI